MVDLQKQIDDHSRVPAPDHAHREPAQHLLDAVPEDASVLLDLANQSIVSARQFDREKVIQLCRLAAKYETSPTPVQRPLTGKILISAFYEPSTRTRLSFESAWHRLGGDIMSITDSATTGIAKGESYKDIAEMLNAYGDVVVLRDNHEQAVYEMMESLRIPIINAGNGVDEHPTQALADIYCMLKRYPVMLRDEVPDTQKLRIAIIGVPGRMRTVRSLLVLLSLFSPALHEVVIITNEKEPFSPGQEDYLKQQGLNCRVTTDLNEQLSEWDIIYINAIAWVGDSYESHGIDYKLTADLPYKTGATIMHPLARGEELSTDLDNTPYNGYFDQARGAVFLRMALLTCYVWLF